MTCKECGNVLTPQDKAREFHYQDRLCIRCRNAAEVRQAKAIWYGDTNERR